MAIARDLHTYTDEWLRFFLAVEESHCSRAVEYTAKAIWNEQGIEAAIKYINEQTSVEAPTWTVR